MNEPNTIIIKKYNFGWFLIQLILILLAMFDKIEWWVALLPTILPFVFLLLIIIGLFIVFLLFVICEIYKEIKDKRKWRL